MDHNNLPIQASAVPCEHVFLSSTETNTKKRNRLSPLMMEALQMLKFYLKKECLHFMRGCVTDCPIYLIFSFLFHSPSLSVRDSRLLCPLLI